MIEKTKHIQEMEGKIKSSIREETKLGIHKLFCGICTLDLFNIFIISRNTYLLTFRQRTTCYSTHCQHILYSS